MGLKGIDSKDKQMRFFPVLQGLMEVNATIKKKQGYIKLRLPDEMLNFLMRSSMGIETEAEQFLISFRYKDQNSNIDEPKDIKISEPTIENTVCSWKRDSDEGSVYHTGCDGMFEISNDASLYGNNIKFCPYCGGEIKVEEQKNDDTVTKI